MLALAQEVTMAFQKRIRLTGSFEQREGEIGEYVWSMNLCYPPDVISHGREMLTQGVSSLTSVSVFYETS